MEVLKNGYAFPITDYDGRIAITEEFNSGMYAGLILVDTLFGVGLDFKPVIPAIKYKGKFISLSEFINTYSVDRDEFETFKVFLNSRKATYSVVDPAFMFCSLHGKYDAKTKEWVTDRTSLDLYLPQKKCRYGNKADYIICSRVSTIAGLNTVVIEESLYDKATKTILDYIAQSYESREKFLSLRIGLS